MSESNFAARREAFRKLHKSGCFVIPNPWDPGSARYLKHLGFKALATTSAGFAFSRGLPDDGGVVSRDAVLGNIAEITAAVRSEERRVGKECGCRGAAGHGNQ